MIKAIFFDSGGVLVKECFKVAANDYEKKDSIPENLLYVSMHDGAYWKDFTLGKITEAEYYGKVEVDFGQKLDVDELRKIIYNKASPNVELYEFLKILKQKYQLGVISNNPREWFDYFWNNYHWGDLFQIKAVSSYLHIRKPDPRIFAHALYEAGVDGEESIYIDDRPDRVQGAKDLGMSVVKYESVQQLKKDLNHVP